MISSVTAWLIFAPMKHKHSITQINIDRDREMLLLYHRAKRLVQWPTTTAKICEYVSKMPTSCYYLSDMAAYRYVSNRLKGKVPKFGIYQQMKQRLCEAFFIDFLDVRSKDVNKDKSLIYLVIITLERPGPNLGLTPRYIQEKISAQLKKKSR